VKLDARDRQSRAPFDGRSLVNPHGSKSLVFALVTGVPFAMEAAAQAADTFAPPVRLKAGDKFMGEGRLYPSPVFHDVNGDGLPDVVVGDLPGFLTVALRLPGADPTAFGPETNLKDFEGKDLKSHNW
jgi:hypothetical protein